MVRDLKVIFVGVQAIHPTTGNKILESQPAPPKNVSKEEALDMF